MLLQTDGLLVITVYRGHSGAEKESTEVNKFLKTLPKQNYSVLKGCYINQGDKSPYWIMIQKNKEG